MSKQTKKLKKQLIELESEMYKQDQMIKVMKNTYEDRFSKLLEVINGNGKMTSFSDFQEISLSEALGIENGF